MSKNVFSGMMPALMTPCKPDRTPDFDALVRKGKELVGAGMAGVIYCGSMGDWPLLSDEQRMTGVEGLVKAGLRVIVGTGAQNPMRAAALAAHANKVGAAGLMVIPRVLSRGSSAAAQYAHFAGILEAGGNLPAVIYNSPYYGFETKADLFFALHDKYPQLIGFKEFGSAQAMSYAAEHITGNLPVSRVFGHVQVRPANAAAPNLGDDFTRLRCRVVEGLQRQRLVETLHDHSTHQAIPDLPGAMTPFGSIAFFSSLLKSRLVWPYCWATSSIEFTPVR
mgnify:CR=1 FL=1